MSEPLTAEEEAALRADVADRLGRSSVRMEGRFIHDVARLLATLDAARSATPSSEEELREALAEDAALLHHYVHPDVSFEDCDGARCVRRRAALAATPSSEEDAWPSDKDLHDSLAAHARSPEHHYTADDCRRALATTPARSDAGDGLDVGRLALFDALIDEGFAHIAALMREVPSWKPAYYGAEVWLREVPRRVARLSESTGSEDTR